jgi:hypothetical protein
MGLDVDSEWDFFVFCDATHSIREDMIPLSASAREW